MNGELVGELSLLSDDVLLSLVRLEQIEELMKSPTGFADAAIAAELQDLALKLGMVSAKIGALAVAIGNGI